MMIILKRNALYITFFVELEVLEAISPTITLESDLFSSGHRYCSCEFAYRFIVVIYRLLTFCLSSSLDHPLEIINPLLRTLMHLFYFTYLSFSAQLVRHASFRRQ